MTAPSTDAAATDVAIKITTWEQGDIIFQTDTLEKNMRRIMDTKEEGVRKALIRLGWTPPSLTPSAPEQREDHPHDLAALLRRCQTAAKGDMNVEDRRVLIADVDTAISQLERQPSHASNEGTESSDNTLNGGRIPLIGNAMNDDRSKFAADVDRVC